MTLSREIALFLESLIGENPVVTTSTTTRIVVDPHDVVAAGDIAMSRHDTGRKITMDVWKRNTVFTLYTLFTK
jgi:hypothetical protein